MKNQFVNIQNDNNIKLFDRKLLIGGYNRKGYYIPDGGVIVKKKNLAGYIDNKWKIIGKINNKQHIPSYRDIKILNGGKINKQELSLVNAIRLLRDYYINNL